MPRFTCIRFSVAVATRLSTRRLERFGDRADANSSSDLPSINVADLGAVSKAQHFLGVQRGTCTNSSHGPVGRMMNKGQLPGDIRREYQAAQEASTRNGTAPATRQP